MLCGRLAGFVLVVGFCTNACTTVHGSAIATTATPQAPYAGPVRFSALYVPPGSVQLGLVQASGTGELQELLDELRRQTAALGGNWTIVDRLSTTFELQTVPITTTTKCGTTTCTTTRMQTTEVGTTQLLGRALRTGNSP
jgi:hypothetical protein